MKTYKPRLGERKPRTVATRGVRRPTAAKPAKAATAAPALAELLRKLM